VEAVSAVVFLIFDVFAKRCILKAGFVRTFECVSVVLCLEPLLASPALVFASATAFVPPAAPLMIAVLKEDFLPIASKDSLLMMSI